MKTELEASILLGLTVLLGIGDYLIQSNQNNRGKGVSIVFILTCSEGQGYGKPRRMFMDAYSSVDHHYQPEP